MESKLKNLLAQNVGITVATDMLYMVSRFFLPPLILSHISIEAYGIWSICFILIGYVGMSAIGVSNVYLRFIAEYSTKNQPRKINKLITTGLFTTFFIGCLILAAVWITLPNLIALFNISPDLQTPAKVLIFATCATFIAHLSLGSFTYVLEGLQQFTPGKVIWAMSFLLEGLLIFVFLNLNYGLYALVYAFTTRYAISIVFSYLACRRYLPTLSLHPRNFDRDMLRLFFNYGGIVQITGFLSMILRSIEKALSSFFLGVSATGLFEIGEKLPIMANSIPHCIAGPILPAISHLHAKGLKDQIIQLYLKSARYMALLSGLIMGFLAAFASPIIQAWIGTEPQYTAAATILAIFTLPFQMEMLTAPGSAVHQGVEQPTRTLRYPLYQLGSVAICVSIAFVLFSPSIETISYGVGLGMIISAIAYIIYTNALLALSQKQFFTRVLLPSLIPYVLGFVSQLIFQPAFAWAGPNRFTIACVILIAGSVYALLCSLFIYHFILKPDERNECQTQLTRLLSKVYPIKGALT